MNRKLCIVLASLVFLLPAGCALLDPGPPMANVILPLQLPAGSQAERMPVQLLVARPSADGATNSDRIMALMNGYEIRALDSAKWVSPVPAIVQRQLVDALEASRRFAAVNWEESNVDDKYRLSTDIRRFFLRYDVSGSAPVADTAMVFSLVRSDTGKIVARRFVRVEEACQGNSLDAFVAAFSRAMTKTLAQTTEWVVQTLEAQPLAEGAKK
ncbi:MAG: ABC-type transport auxiliary lipoprotein family protein [Deltaproteobacteria bacterium]|nr:ABC-type transport auxiliary lipoprotein family protein [Deltaproteobacteria bacterium]